MIGTHTSCISRTSSRQLAPAGVLRALSLNSLRCFSTARKPCTEAYKSAGRTCNVNQEDWEAEEEPLKDYDPAKNGYLPVNIGDFLGSRYALVRKLGWGVYSTVWIAQDQSASKPEQPAYAAVKIMTRVATEAQNRLKELDLMRRMRDGSPSHPGYSHVVQLQDHFHQQGPHGKHLCLVMEPLLQDLRSLTSRFKRRIPPPYFVRLLARQVVLGLQYLHDECDIIHTDVKLSNVMMVAPMDPAAFLAMTIPKLEGSDDTFCATGPDGSPIPRVRSRPIAYPLPDVHDMYSFDAWTGMRAKIGDVGVACWADKVEEHFTDLIQAPPLRAPEVTLGAGWGKPADVWSLGCGLYELYMGRALFGRNINEKWLPTLHARVFGDYPSALVTRGKYRDAFYTPHGSLRYPPKDRVSLDEAILQQDAPDAALFADFLRLTFALDPDERATCGDLLKHPWLNP
ncbi:kinase-like protein [Trametes maxima]|nr:kinase-like protein [Trametes maxima]